MSHESQQHGEKTAGRPPDDAPVCGLTSAEAAARLAADGPNVLPPPPQARLWRRVAAQLRDPLVVVLLAAAVLTSATGDWTDASVIMLVIVVNTSVRVTQEVKADQAITALSQLTAPEARVLRDGEQRQVPADDVVVGDLLVLAEGDIVPADARLAEAAALLVDESALTGESVPVDKGAGDGRGQPAGLVSAGTVIVRGRDQAVVTATGTASAMGRVAALMQHRAALAPCSVGWPGSAGPWPGPPWCCVRSCWPWGGSRPVHRCHRAATWLTGK